MQVTWSIDAIDDLESVRTYIASDNPRTAARMVLRMLDAVHQLGVFPESGRVGRVSGTRELVVTELSLFVVYRVQDDVVYVLRVLHTARAWPVR